MADNFKLIQARKFQLAGSISLADTSITVKLFTDPNGTDLTMTDFGAIGYGTLEPSTSKMEIISFTGVTQNGNSTATLTGVTRGLKFVEPYDQDLTLRKSHGGNAVFILTNNPQVYAQFTSKNNNETVAEEWTFSTNPVKGSATLAASNDAYITKNDLLAATLGTVITDQVVIPGTAGETITTKQIVYFKESDQRWWLADADLVGTFNQVVVAVAQNNANAGASLNVLLQGLDKTQTGMTLGSKYYLSNTAGGISTTPGTTEVFLGWAQTATQFIFDPLGLYQPTSGEKAAMAGNGGTPSSTNKFVTEEGAYKVLKFGGSGVDGALAISSGTTTIDLGGARIFERNYTSISITGTGALAFTNPNTKGTVITLKSQGDVIITSTATNAISTIGMGAAGGLYGQSGGINPANQGRAGEIPHSLFFATDNPSALQNAVAGTQVVSDFYTYTKEQLNKKTIFLIPGGGGGGANGGSGANQNNAGSGGNGGGSLYIECAGAWNFTGQINTSGASGTNAQAPAAGVAGLSGGGGGSAGMLLVLYNTLTTNSGTVVALGGSGGNGASATGNSLATDSSGAGAGSFGAVGAASVNSSGANGNNSTLGAGASGGCGFDGTGSGGTGGVCTSSMSTLILKNYYF